MKPHFCPEHFRRYAYRNIMYNMDGFEAAPTCIAHVNYNFFNPKAVSPD